MIPSVFVLDCANAVEKCEQQKKLYLDRPKIVDIKKYNGQRLVAAEGVLYFKEPNQNSYPLDLAKGWERGKGRTDDYYHSNMKQIEDYLMSEKAEEQKCETKDVKVFAKRAALDRIMSIPFSNRNVYIHVTKFKHAIYLMLGEGRIYDASCSLMHSQFKQFCLSDDPGKAPNTDKPIDENVQTYCVYRSSLKEFDMLYSAEITGVISDQRLKDINNFDELNAANFIHLKLLNEFKPETWYKSKKIIHWWTQAYLTGTSEICFGFKNTKDEVAIPVQRVKTHELPNNQIWQPHICNRFLHTFLTLVKNTMVNIDCPYTVFEFQYDSRKKHINYKSYLGQNKHSFLNEEFIEYMLKK